MILLYLSLSVTQAVISLKEEAVFAFVAVAGFSILATHTHPHQRRERCILYNKKSLGVPSTKVSMDVTNSFLYVYCVYKLKTFTVKS